ncbi:hypothetical protein GALMADRAFT_1145560 [Galerina marginata CBS 339.88]|uniref:NADP-dependent oxidoreductase domain-containing protein n=1 Tax=Galerina marginata (strain CBS 339.88) TaxID=685588 RepID=A0A067S6Y9_GALM3|nr:hypothetical protein GALMADRAFT_232432 [Galerina marginata CBS 339.88]KDR66563.1 hypothetical protein GALMADRAFT_1145560 [Galerina marginata CBS 339.88]
MPFGNVKLNDGNKIPAIAFGTGSALSKTDVTNSIIQALKTGFSHLDTAQRYGTERYVGAAIKGSKLSRADIYVCTKYNTGPTFRQTLEESLEILGLTYVDLFLIHYPERMENHDWKEVEMIKQDGLARSIGVSNYNLPQLQALVERAKIKPAVNQIFFHCYNYKNHKALIEYAARHNIIIEAYGCLDPITKYPGGPVDAPLAAAAKRRGVLPVQILLAWVKAKVPVFITTSTSKQHLQEHLAAADIRPLTGSEIAAIDAASARGPPS